MKMKSITKWLLASAACGLLSLASAQASTIDLTNNMSYTADSQYLIGTVIPGLQGQYGGQAERDAYMTNVLRGMGSHTQGDPDSTGSLFSRTTWPSGPAATDVGAQLGTNIPDGGPTLTITLTGAFQYLVAAYDGPNADAGVAVWDISSLSAGDTIVIARYANAPDPSSGDLVANANGPYKITSWTLLNPLGTVPDGGTTVMLLGAALSTLGLARRFFLKS